MKPKQILVCGKIAKEGLDTLLACKDLKVDVVTDLSFENLKKIIPTYHGMIVRSDTQVTNALLEAAQNLQVIVRAGIGIDNVDVKAATQKGILVMNTPSGNVITTAEHALSMLMALSRNIPQATASMKQGLWEKKKFIGTELFGKTLGVIGLGNVGKIVADRAQGLKMKVIAYDPFLSKEVAKKLSVELVSLDVLLSRADFVTVHVPLSDKTRNLIDAKALSKMKPSAFLIQCARGGIVNEADLYKALQKQKIKGAALDVFEEEPPTQNPLLQLNNLICTPHLGASTEEAQVKVGVETAEQLVAYFLKGTIQNAINMPSLSSEQMDILKPYFILAEKLGSFLGQVIEPGRILAIEIGYHGKLTEYNLNTLTHAIVTGFLREHMEKSVNYVNSLLVAKDRGIDVKTTRFQDESEFTNLISLRVRTEQRVYSVKGTIFNRAEPRFVQIDQFQLEAIPEGNILFSRNKNKPGVIGAIGTLLGKEKINISRFQLGLDEKAGEALSLINVDSPIQKDLLEKLLKLDHILTVKRVSL